MEYINKIGSLFSSPPPVSVSDKRKADRVEDVEKDEEFDRATFDSSPSTSASNGEHDGYYDQWPPQPPQKRLRSSKTAAKRGEILRNSNDKFSSYIESSEFEQSRTAQPQAEWSTQPNRRARELLSANNGHVSALLHDLNEPAYACRDIEIRDGLRKLTTQIKDLAASHFSFDVVPAKLPFMLRSLPDETVKIIGCVASGGPAGAKGWEALFLEDEKRQALVCAIIGNVLVEQVLQHMFFGGTEEQINDVSALQFEHRHADGFHRTALYAAKVRSFLTLADASTEHSAHLPATFNTHLSHIVAALSTHLTPLLHLSSPPPISSTDDLLPRLHALTTLAGLLSLHMRLDAQTAYHFAPAFKNSDFSSGDMSCFNHAEMAGTQPRGSGVEEGLFPHEMARREGLSGSERERMRGDGAVVQVCVFPGVVACRRAPTPNPEDTAVSVRVRRLTTASVYCRWGRGRAWTDDGKPADEPAVHGAAWNGGFIEFKSVVLDAVQRSPLSST